MENNLRSKVAIIIFTLNRPDFVIRQLEYYAKVKCPHPIYIGDSSNEENKKKLQAVIKKLDQHLTINYYAQPENWTIQKSSLDLQGNVKEKYCVFSGDDDYQIPNSITKCAEFLENNPEYSSASGYSITFRLTNKEVYGELQRLGDYPRQQIESSTAAQRMVDFMGKFNITEFSVQKTEQLPKCWSSDDIKDPAFANDIMSSAMGVVLGKSKVLDCLSFIKQIDNSKSTVPNVFEWVTSKEWNPSFNIFCEIFAKEISATDGITVDKARKITEQAVWTYLNIWLPYYYKKIYGSGKKNSLLSKLKKKIYLKIKPPLYRQVVRPSSPYYKDFQPVFDSFTGKYHEH